MVRTFDLCRWFRPAQDKVADNAEEASFVWESSQGGALRLDRDVLPEEHSNDDDVPVRLARIWQNLLGLESVEFDQNYFDLGGDSCVTIQLFVQIEKAFGVKLPVTSLFEAPTVAELAVVLRREIASIKAEPSKSLAQI